MEQLQLFLEEELICPSKWCKGKELEYIQEDLFEKGTDIYRCSVCTELYFVRDWKIINFVA